MSFRLSADESSSATGDPGVPRSPFDAIEPRSAATLRPQSARRGRCATFASGWPASGSRRTRKRSFATKSQVWTAPPPNARLCLPPLSSRRRAGELLLELESDDFDYLKITALGDRKVASMQPTRAAVARC